MTNLEDKELSQITGGFAFVIPVSAILGFLASDAWSHADEIASGAKTGWEIANKYKIY
ncbi:bacteriocin [Lacticaseibacillus paracasei]|uniref:bacteriocin n=1 Tax=Lacticaseibacillus paracasei TaxID=1597 RepID=UPI0031D9C204